MKPEFEVIIQEMNGTGEVVREKVLMKTKFKNRAVSFFNDEVDRLSYYINHGSELMIVKYDGMGSDIIKKTK